MIKDNYMFIKDPGDYKAYGFTDPVCIEGYNNKGYNRLTSIISGVCFGMGMCRFETQNHGEIDILFPTLSQKETTITSSLLSQINVFLSDFKNKFSNTDCLYNYDNHLVIRDLNGTMMESFHDIKNDALEGEMHEDDDCDLDEIFRLNHYRTNDQIRYINVNGVAEYKKKRLNRVIEKDAKIEKKRKNNIFW